MAGKRRRKDDIALDRAFDLWTMTKMKRQCRTETAGPSVREAGLTLLELLVAMTVLALLLTALDACKIGQEVDAVVLRAGKKLTLRIKLGGR